ncbi:hypothetical protein Ahy_A01g002221 [Arachis hypogaea]|uniref:Uncharacterized protein n=1 Tax=Arachis hypogaea TaxID=3818 RepID=A0A445EQA4_ARAHY|nr:hypothetical protein Ahy_A01g002221 [Arachis hypogaea]
MVAYQQQVEESHHDLVNLLTQQMTTILNPMMADHESRFERLARQVERIARIVDYDEGERHNARGTNEEMENIFQNENHVLNRENSHIKRKSILKQKSIWPNLRKALHMLLVFSGSETVKSFKGVIICIDEILNGDIERRLEVNMLLFEGESEDTREEEEEKGISIRIRNFNLIQGRKQARGAIPSVHSRSVFPSDGETYPKEILSPANMDKGKAIAQSSGVDKNVDVDEEYF